ncbi:MAG: zinc metallopeptidase [Immundisolibacteraceae bacterium]|nr:zinc metallopeptidase [Immundisolibacteraceae bacterium]
MHWLLLVAAILAVIAVPQWWVKRTLNRYDKDRPDLAGTGGELVTHLIKQLELNQVTLLGDAQGDHYNPIEKQVCLTESICNRKSLTAVVVAAHEVGHAIQDHQNYRPLLLRTRIARFCSGLEQASSYLLIAIPLVMLLTRTPHSGLFMLIMVIVSVAASVGLNLITLPVEFDASFNRALPLLEKGGYLSESDLPAARKILTACALTYVAASLISLLNAWRWLRLARR